MMLCRARPRLHSLVASQSLNPSTCLEIRTVSSRNANPVFIRPTATRLVRPSQVAFFRSKSAPKLPIDLSSYPVPEGTRVIRLKSDAHFSTVDPPPPNKKTDDNAKAALRFESPAWLAIASGHDGHRQKLIPVVDMTRTMGRHRQKEDKKDASDSLQAVLDEVDSQTEILHIVGRVPTNDEWEVLGRHFTSVRLLRVDADWDEDWNDDKFPLNWALELLVIADAAGERISTPAILEGRIQSLVLLFTTGLRFEGPNTKELMENAEQLDFFYPQKTEKADETQADTEPSDTTPSQSEGSTPSDTSSPKDDASNPSPKPDSKPQGVKVCSVPYEWRKWFHAHYANKDLTFSPGPATSPPSSMRTLQILGNDALQMFSYLALARPHLLSSLSTLTLYSPGRNDLQHIPAHLPLIILHALENLQTFRLTLGSAMYTTFLSLVDDAQPFLHAFLPPNVEALLLRGPVSMTPHLEEFAAAFDYDDFLPRLKRLSFVLDLPDKRSESPREASLEQLRAARRGCKGVVDAAVRKRGVVVEGFGEPWVEEHGGLFDKVDNRWWVLDEVVRGE